MPEPIRLANERWEPPTEAKFADENGKLAEVVMPGDTWSLVFLADLGQHWDIVRNRIFFTSDPIC